MHFHGFFTFLFILSGTINSGDLFSSATCENPQYLDFGKTGTLNCFFHDHFFSVLWYNTTDSSHHDPILHYQGSSKTGSGYESGEYDIHPNGSLIINDVSLQHEKTFTVVYIYTKKEGPTVFTIQVVVIVKPEVPFPVIQPCGNLTKTCFVQVYPPFIQCSVQGARPNVTLKWMARTMDGDGDVTYDISVVSRGLTSTSYVTANDIFLHSSPLVLLVCKAFSKPRLLDSDESLCLVQDGDIDFSNNRAVPTYVERNTEMVLTCSEQDVKLIVWKKASPPWETTYDLLLYSVLTEEKFKEILVENVSVGRKGSLIISPVDLHHDGFYYCIFGDGINGGISVYNVTVIDYPSPPYLAVDGCNFEQDCALEVQNEGSLTCLVTAIRPLVELQWKTFYDRDAAAIYFTRQNLKVKDNGDTFDVTLTTSYLMKDGSRDRLTVICTLVQPPEIFSDLQKKVDLLFVHDLSTEHIDVRQSAKINLPVVLVIVILLLLLLLGTLGIFIIIKRNRKRKKSGLQQVEPTTEEEMPMVHSKASKKNDDKDKTQREIEDMRETMINQLKEKYKDLYNAVKPIPYLKDRQYCVDTIFVDGGIEFRHDDVGAKSTWKRLNSYADIFDSEQIEFTRLVIEGEPGYGKSTIALQIAYDWCNQKQASNLKDVQILILLRLRQLGGVYSIFRAIKYFLLPYESLLQEEDIGDVLTNTKSVVIIMDGYDEYPDQNKTSEIMKIFQRDMFQTFQVIMTTRRSCLPLKFSPQTKRLRLMGFDDKAQENYIRKALVIGENKHVEQIKFQLQDNPVLSGLCQVPLFFAMYTHITAENKTNLKFKSVTNFFQHMVTCFHEHMKNKMDDANVAESELFEKNHGKLDKLAFEALSGKDAQAVWVQEDIRGRLGRNFYDAYVRTGILVEEESLQFVKQLERKTLVRFYHKLFCEWYAAHFLSNYASKFLSFKLGDIVKKTSPFHLQYLYQFACGLNRSASGKIIKYVKELDGGDKFAILCIMEQTESIENVKETICQICAKGVQINNDDSLLLQTFSVQMLEIAAKNNIPILLVRLQNSLESIDLSAAVMKTKSGLVLPSRVPIERLQICETTKEMSKHEATSILEFSSKCTSLKALWYLGCRRPEFSEVDSTLSILKSRNIQVYWRRTEDEPIYFLNLQLGCWETISDESQRRQVLTE